MQACSQHEFTSADNGASVDVEKEADRTVVLSGMNRYATNCSNLRPNLQKLVSKIVHKHEQRPNVLFAAGRLARAAIRSLAGKSKITFYALFFSTLFASSSF